MVNKDLDFSLLNNHEIFCLSTFIVVSIRSRIIDYYHFGTYSEQSICINKNNDIWQVYITERGNAFEKEEFNNIVDACICAIKHGCDSKKQENKLVKCFKDIINNNLDNIELLHEDGMIKNTTEYLSYFKNNKGM